jgi:hypothetical protein
MIFTRPYLLCSSSLRTEATGNQILLRHASFCPPSGQRVQRVTFRRSEQAFKDEGTGRRSLLRAEPWWSMAFGAPLFVRALLRLVFLCPHWHKGPPITLRESIPSNLPGCRSVDGRETYITCLDCGQKFAYNCKSRRLVDFWGIHDVEALAEVRRSVVGFFSPLRGLVARVGRLNMKIPRCEVVGSLHRPGILTKGQ